MRRDSGDGENQQEERKKTTREIMDEVKESMEMVGLTIGKVEGGRRVEDGEAGGAGIKGEKWGKKVGRNKEDKMHTRKRKKGRRKGQEGE